MKTIERTPFGDFAMNWGVVSPHEGLALLGIALGEGDGDASSRAVLCRDPSHGERVPIYFYVDANGVTYALGEITNGIWVVGVAVDGARPPTGDELWPRPAPDVA